MMLLLFVIVAIRFCNYGGGGGGGGGGDESIAV